MGYFSKATIEAAYNWTYDPNRTVGDRMNPGPKDTFQAKQRVRIAAPGDPLDGSEGIITLAQGHLYQVQIGWHGVWVYANALVAL